jgi:putative autoinducer-2 (AI-2) aldolase
MKMAQAAVEEGAAGVDMGRNIFQSTNPVGMIQAIRHVVHEKAAAEQVFAAFQEAGALAGAGVR